MAENNYKAKNRLSMIQLIVQLNDKGGAVVH